MAKRCTVYGPRRPDDMDVKDFLDFARNLERAKRQTAVSYTHLTLPTICSV